MADYHTFLTRKIQEASDNPAKMREVVYEAARLALRWQVQGQWPRLSTSAANHQVDELEEAIARLEANTAGPGVLGKREPGKAAAALEASAQSHPSEEHEFDVPRPQARDAPSAESAGPRAVAASLGGQGKSEGDNAAAGFEESHPQPTSAALTGLEAVARSLGGHGEREPRDAAAGFKAGWQSPGAPVESAEDNGQSPPSARQEGLESIAGSPGGARFNASRQSHNAPIEPESGDGPDPFGGGQRPGDPPSAGLAGPKADNAAAGVKTASPNTFEESHPQPTSAALAGLEAVARSLGGHGEREPHDAAASLKASWQSRDGPLESEEDNGPDRFEKSPPSAEPADSEAVARLGGRSNREPGKGAAGVNTSRQSHAPIEPADLPDPFEGSYPQPRDPGVGAAARLTGRGIREPGRAAAGLTASRKRRKEDDALDTVEEPPELPRAEPAARDKREPGNAVASFKASRQGRYVSIEEDDAPDEDEEHYPQPRHSPSTGSRELVLVRDRARSSTYVVNPVDFVSPDVTYMAQPLPRCRARMIVSALRVVFQLAVATLAVTSFYLAMWGRNSPVQTAGEMPPAGGQTPSAKPAAPSDRTADGFAAVAVASSAAAPVAPELPFPRPTAYGVYAVRGNRLIELEQVQTTLVDPRNRSQLQIIKPGRTVIDAAKLAFVVYRRELVSNAPDKVQIRIASRIAHSMIFDAAGKPVVTTPETETWLIRDQGYDLRVSPLRESPEMVMLHPDNPEFSFPPGRYELMLGGVPYDFVIAGQVTDPAQCVEGVASVRGPVFYECKQRP